MANDTFVFNASLRVVAVEQTGSQLRKVDRAQLMNVSGIL